MHIHIQSHGCALPEALLAHAERRLRFNLSHASDRAGRAVAHSLERRREQRVETISMAEISAG